MILQSVLLALTGMVLLVVCLNISGMMQVRGAMRERELSVRQAIGASRGRLVRYLLSEAVILSALGSALAMIVLYNIPPVLAWWIGQPIPAEFQEALRPDLSMAAIVVGVCLVTSLVFGLLPALRFSRPAIISSLKDDAGGGGLGSAGSSAWPSPCRSASRFRSLSSAACWSTASVRLQQPISDSKPTGWPPSVSISIPRRRRSSPASFFEVSVRISKRRAASNPLLLPMACRSTSHLGSGGWRREGEAESVRAHVTRVAEGYLDTMDIPLASRPRHHRRRSRGLRAGDRHLQGSCRPALPERRSAKSLASG